MKQYSIKTKLSATILIIVLLSIATISFLSNYFINLQFTQYISKQQQLKTQIIESSLSQQYNAASDEWNIDYIHTIGMLSLYEGYIIKVYDKNNQILWDAQYHDMNLCTTIINEISDRMRIIYPQLQGEYTTTVHQLEQNGEKIGSISIGYFGPFFLDENDVRFLSALNKIFIAVGLIALVISLMVGHMLAKRISKPILRTVEAARHIEEGQYSIRLDEGTDIKELGMLVASINRLAASLETLERLRKQQTEDVAHELRTPITILQSHIEAMLEGIWEPSPERLQSCFDESVLIGKLVSDLENLAKVESSNLKLDKTNIHMNDLIQTAVDHFEAELHRKNIRVSIQGPELTMIADKDRMNQILVNLLSNAIKYSNEGGKIAFEVFKNQNQYGFSIKDEGMGISEDEISYIFERFYRADKSRNRLTGGTGIGLTIVKSIVEAHGGEVKVESAVNQGSCFTITFFS